MDNKTSQQSTSSIETSVLYPTSTSLQFVNILGTKMLKAGKKPLAFSKITKIYAFFKKSRLSSDTFSVLSKFFINAQAPFSLGENTIAGKKVLIPNPARFSKLRNIFVNELIFAVANKGGELDFSKKLCSEIENFNQKTGVVYDNKLHKFNTATVNIHMARRTYGRRIKKSNASKNAFKKNKFFYL